MPFRLLVHFDSIASTTSFVFLSPFKYIHPYYDIEQQLTRKVVLITSSLGLEYCTLRVPYFNYYKVYDKCNEGD